MNTLYDPSALQCKNCGVRYSSTAMIPYSQHLDWHFRMKRREKDNAKKAKSREWYYTRMDWIISEEIEDEEKDMDVDDKTCPDSQQEPPTVPVQDNDAGTCPICREEFEQFFKQDAMDTPKAGATDDDHDARWHYRNAIRVEDGTVYHPACYQDQKKSLERMDSSAMSEATETEDESEAEQTQQVKKEVKEEGEEMHDDKVQSESDKEKMEMGDSSEETSVKLTNSK